MQLNNIDQPLVFVDIETTGMSPRSGGRILEVGAIRLEKGKIISTMNQLVNPECEVPYFITGITGIADHHVSSSPTFDQVAGQLEEITRDAIFVAHNVNFDYSFISSEYERLGQQFVRAKLCTVRLSRALFPDIRGHSLGKLIERHGYQVAARHRAYDDAAVLHRFVTDMHHDNPIATHNAMTRIIC